MNSEKKPSKKQWGKNRLPVPKPGHRFNTIKDYSRKRLPKPEELLEEG